MKKLALTMLLAVPAVAFSATYSVTEQSGATTGAKLTSFGNTGCVYADVPISLGDILTYPDGTRQVCASGPNGPQMIDVAPDRNAGAQTETRFTGPGRIGIQSMYVNYASDDN